MAALLATPLSTALPAQRLMTDVLGLSGRQSDDLRAGKEAQAGTASVTLEANKDIASKESNKESDEVSLSARASESRVEPSLPITYAEVWRGGVKVALIDANGGVKSLSGLVQSSQGTGGAGGILLAARRAAEIAASIGGEIRVGGQAIDQNTLTTKAKLSAAYGV